MAEIEILPWDPADNLETEEDIAACLEAEYEDYDLDLMAEVMDSIARSKAGMGISTKWAGPDGPHWRLCP